MTPSPSAKRTSSRTGRTRISASNCWPCTRKNGRRFGKCCGRSPMLRGNRWRAAMATAIVVAAVTAHAEEDRYELKFSRTLVARGGPLIVEHQFGGVTVSTEKGPHISVRATIRSSDPDYAKNIRIHVNEDGNAVRVRT